jgi:hypothetical protein
MKNFFAALALATLIASPAFAAPFSPSYSCAPTQYDSSGTSVAQYCE